MRNLLCLALLAALSVPVWADPLPPPTSVVTCTDVVVIQGVSSCANGGATARLTLLPFVGERVVAFAPATDENGPHGAGAFADIKYSFRVLGGHPGDLVPVLFTVNLDATATSDHANGFASIFVLTSQGNTQICVVTTAFGCPTGAFSGTFQVMMAAGDGGSIDLEVSASAGDSPFPERASASADPLIFIDPSFPGAGLYAVELSAGVGNGLPVPEPATSTLLSGGGLGLLALTARRRQAAGQRAKGLPPVVADSGCA